MKRVGFALAVLGTVAIAAWSYTVNYRTKQALERVDDLRDRIAATREAIQVLRVEWAYLNAPDRLRRLVALHHHDLGLEPLTQGHFLEAGQVPYPRPPELSAPEPLPKLTGLPGVAEAYRMKAPIPPEALVSPAAALRLPGEAALALGEIRDAEAGRAPGDQGTERAAELAAGFLPVSAAFDPQKADALRPTRMLVDGFLDDGVLAGIRRPAPAETAPLEAEAVPAAKDAGPDDAKTEPVSAETDAHIAAVPMPVPRPLRGRLP